MSTALKYMFVANAGIPIMAYAFFGLTRPDNKLAGSIVIICAILLLITNLFHAKTYPQYRTANIALFTLNGLSFIFFTAISFIDGFYYLGTLIF